MDFVVFCSFYDAYESYLHLYGLQITNKARTISLVRKLQCGNVRRKWFGKTFMAQDWHNQSHYINNFVFLFLFQYGLYTFLLLPDRLQL